MEERLNAFSTQGAAGCRCLAVSIIHSKGIGKVLLLFPIEAKEEKQGGLEYRKERGNNSHKFIHVDNHNFDLLHLHFTGKS